MFVHFTLNVFLALGLSPMLSTRQISQLHQILVYFTKYIDHRFSLMLLDLFSVNKILTVTMETRSSLAKNTLSNTCGITHTHAKK